MQNEIEDILSKVACLIRSPSTFGGGIAKYIFPGFTGPGWLPMGGTGETGEAGAAAGATPAGGGVGFPVIL